MAHLSFSLRETAPFRLSVCDERCLSVSPHFGIFWPHRSTAQPGRPGPLSSQTCGRTRDFALHRDDVKISSVSVSKRKQLPSVRPLPRPLSPTRQTYFAVVARMDPRQRGSGMPTTISTPPPLPPPRAARLCCAGGISCSCSGGVEVGLALQSSMQTCYAHPIQDFSIVSHIYACA